MTEEHLNELKTKSVIYQLSASLLALIAMIIVVVMLASTMGVASYYSIRYPTRVEEVTTDNDYIVSMRASDNGKYYKIEFGDTGDLVLNVPDGVTDPVVVRRRGSNRYLRFGDRGFYVIDRSELNSDTHYHLGKIIQYKEPFDIDSKINFYNSKMETSMIFLILIMFPSSFIVLFLCSRSSAYRREYEELNKKTGGTVNE